MYPDIDWETSNKTLLVKAHEKYVFEYSEDLIMTKIHRDNCGTYPFSKLDFLSHKLQEIVFPSISPVLYAADFSDAEHPAFLIQRISLDEGHKAYNRIHQQEHKNKGDDYRFKHDFFNISSDEAELADKHKKFCEKVLEKYSDSLSKYGIAFDIASVNLTQNDGMPIAVEMHKCRRPYLFNYRRCVDYFKHEHQDKNEVDEAMNILHRIYEIEETMS